MSYGLNEELINLDDVKAIQPQQMSMTKENFVKALIQIILIFFITFISTPNFKEKRLPKY